jgi:putative transposase
MPWQECQKMDERLRFVARLLEGEKMAALCREFDISRQTGHKFYKRYKDLGLQGLTDRSRRPYRQANRLPEALESRIVQLRGEHPSWGAVALLDRLDVPAMANSNSKYGCSVSTGETSRTKLGREQS